MPRFARLPWDLIQSQHDPLKVSRKLWLAQGDTER